MVFADLSFKAPASDPAFFLTKENAREPGSGALPARSMEAKAPYI
jgi:hypothetical protein